MEPVGLKPDMSPDPIVKEKAFNLLESITVTQVVSKTWVACCERVRCQLSCSSQIRHTWVCTCLILAGMGC